jgi:hypothetical protein
MPATSAAIDLDAVVLRDPLALGPKQDFPAGALWDKTPTLVLVIRRPGCAFCREEAAEISSLRSAISKAWGIRMVAVVHEEVGFFSLSFLGFLFSKKAWKDPGADSKLAPLGFSCFSQLGMEEFNTFWNGEVYHDSQQKFYAYLGEGKPRWYGYAGFLNPKVWTAISRSKKKEASKRAAFQATERDMHRARHGMWSLTPFSLSLFFFFFFF